MKSRHRVPALDVVVTPCSTEETVDLVLNAARSGESLVVGNLNLHGVYVYHTDHDFKAFTDAADLVLIDGAPVAWAAKVSTKLRVGSTDWLDALMPQADGLNILAVGGTPEASAGAQRHFREQFPTVDWTGVDGYSSQAVDEVLAAKIAAAQVVLVGMGMPLQERWIIRHRDLLVGKVTANVGGCFDYYAGTQRLAPRWMGRLGIEWVYRLAANPARLAYRYLVEPVRLAFVLARVRRDARD